MDCLILIKSIKLKKIIIHCQYVYGIGHFVRTIQLATTLIKEFEVYIVNGGQIINQFPIHENIRIINIPAIYKDEKENLLIPVDNNLSLQECLDKRLAIIKEVVLNIKPEVVITEHFPFGFLFKDEALAFINSARVINPTLKVVASVRDVIENNIGNPNDNLTIKILNESYDLLLIHGDKNIISIKDSFPLFNKIKINIKHTGYIVQELTTCFNKNEKINILVSIGAGRLGSELLVKVLESYSLLNKDKYNLTLFTGVFQENKESILSELNLDNVEMYEFDRNIYLSKLSVADLVISLGGYNSMMEAISLNKRILVYNRQFLGANLEQDIRINTFKNLNLLESFTSDTSAVELSEMIVKITNIKDNKAVTINFSGALNSLTEIKNTL